MIISHEIGLEEFKATIDYIEIKEQIEKERKYFDEDIYTKIGEDDVYLTEEEYNSNIDKMLDALSYFSNPSKVKEAIRNFPKKKNGTFKINQTLILAKSNNSIYEDDLFGYTYNVLRYKAINDREIVMQYFSLIAGW